MRRLALALIVACAPSCWADSPVRRILTRDLTSEQQETLAPDATAKNVAGRMSPEQKEAALVRLRDLERGLPQPPPILKEMGDAYLALGSSADAARSGTMATKVAVEETADAFAGAQVAYAESAERVGQYRPPPKDRLKGFPEAKRAKKKTPVARGGGKRARWKSDDGKIYAWDSRHGRVEVYDKRGRHIGEFDPDTGQQIKPANPTRRVEP